MLLSFFFCKAGIPPKRWSDGQINSRFNKEATFVTGAPMLHDNRDVEKLKSHSVPFKVKYRSLSFPSKNSLSRSLSSFRRFPTCSKGIWLASRTQNHPNAGIRHWAQSVSPLVKTGKGTKQRHAPLLFLLQFATYIT